MHAKKCSQQSVLKWWYHENNNIMVLANLQTRAVAAWVSKVRQFDDSIIEANGSSSFVRHTVSQWLFEKKSPQRVYQKKSEGRYPNSLLIREVDVLSVFRTSSWAFHLDSAREEVWQELHHNKVEHSTIRHKAIIQGNRHNGYDVLLWFIFEFSFRMKQSWGWQFIVIENDPNAKSAGRARGYVLTI